jgi:hypothetical protein
MRVDISWVEPISLRRALHMPLPLGLRRHQVTPALTDAVGAL